MRGQAKPLMIAIRNKGEKREHPRQSEDQQTTHRSSGPRRNCGRGSECKINCRFIKSNLGEEAEVELTEVVGSLRVQ